LLGSRPIPGLEVFQGWKSCVELAMTSYSDLIARRFGDDGAVGEGVDDNETIRRVLARKTVRRYSDKMPSEELLGLLVAAALSASAKCHSCCHLR